MFDDVGNWKMSVMHVGAHVNAWIHTPNMELSLF